MRWQRYSLFALAGYLLMAGASLPYTTFLPVRVATHTLLTVALAAWLIMRIRGRRYLPVTPLNGALVAGAGVLALSAAFSIDPRMAIEHSWWPLVHMLLFCVFAALVQQGRQRWLFELFFLMSAITVLMAGADVVGWAGRALLAGGESGPDPLVLTGPMAASTALAGFVTPQILITLVWATTARQRRERSMLAALGFALGVVLLGTGSRGGLLALAAGAVTLLCLRLAPSLWTMRRGGHRSWRVALSGVGAALLIMVITVGVVLQVSRQPDHSSGDVTRVSLWASAAAAAQDHPLLGIGVGQYGRALRLYRAPDAPADFQHRQAHNLVLNTVAEEGIAGLLALGAMGVMLLAGWLRQRRTATGARALRLDAVLAALVAAVTQLQFDVFYATPYVGMLALLAAYAVTPPVLIPPRRLEKAAAWGALALVVGFGLFWIPVDLAQSAFEQSVRDSDLPAAARAAALDPALQLYPLQIAYLTGQQAQTDPARLDDAIRQYEAALALEPTWDTGWINLAGLYEQAGRIEDALAALARARRINPLSAAGWNLARLTGHPTANDLPAPENPVDPHFEDVLYGRNAAFTLLPGLTPPGT